MKNLSRKLATSRYLQVAVVTGRGQFPLDMFRYDRCYPHTGDDVSALHASMEVGHGLTCTVTVARTVERASDVWTAARWNSFGWALEEVRA